MKNTVKRQIASASGTAGMLQRKAEKLQVAAQLPYTSQRNVGQCSVCLQKLAAGSDYSVIPHTPRTCPGAGMRTSMGG